MAIRIFVFVLLIVSIISFVASFTTNKQKVEDQDRAALTFHDSTIYILTENNVESIVNSKKVMRYKNRDVMYNGELINKVKNSDNIVDSVKSDIILKIADKLTFINNVHYQRGNTIVLKTDELNYDTKTKIATNNKPFVGTYNSSELKGDSLYLDLNQSIIKAKNSTFRIEMNK